MLRFNIYTCIIFLLLWHPCNAQEPDTFTKDKVFINADGLEERQPKYPGDFLKTFFAEWHLPAVEPKFFPKGKVFVWFIIEKTGSMTVADIDMALLIFPRKAPELVQEQFRQDVVKEIHRTGCNSKLFAPN
jgi:hypothetical protein